MNIATSIRVMCAKTGYKQKQLAGELGITQQYLNKIMKDNRFVRESRLQEMADFFGVPVSEFIRAGE